MRVAVLAGLFALLATSASSASPIGRGEPRLRDRVIVATTPRGAPATPGARSTAAPTALHRLAAQGWRATWDRDTAVPARLWGSFVPAPGTTADAALAEAAARRFLAEHVDALAPGASARDFVLVANQRDGELRTVGFQQTWRGVPVVGGNIGFVFGHDRLFAVGSSAWPHVHAALPIMRTLRGTRAILPRVAAGRIAYHDVDVVDDGTARTYRDVDGRELARDGLRARATATLEYNVPLRHPGGARADLPAPAATVTVNGTSATTSTTGSLSWPGSSAATVVPSVTGTYVRVINRAGAPASASLTAQPGQPVVWDVASDELADAQLSAFVHTNIAKAKARVINPSESAWLDGRLDVHVNESTSCNASAAGDGLHFDRASAQCANTARLADIVYHELAHLLHGESVIAGMGAFERHLSEGLADFFAANLTGDPAVGRGFHLGEAPLRDIDPAGAERVYPVDFDFDPHISGLIIAGALWDLRKALVKQLGADAGVARVEKIFTGIMQRADDIGTTFTAALIADDDDGDLGNRTPNYCAIERAFGSHGLVPDLVTTRVGAPLVEERDIAVTVDTPAAATCPPPIVVAIEVTWRAGDAVASSFELVPDGGVWRGTFPPQRDGTLISYAVDVIYDDGSVQVFPNNPADPTYQLFVGGAVPIHCETFDTDPQWQQSSNLGFEWQWGPPAIGLVGQDPAAAKTSTNVLGTDLAGDGRYRSNLIVSVSTPTIDVSALQIIRLQYWRWLTVEDAFFDQATIRANNVEVWRNAKSAQTGTLDHVDREWRFHDIDLTPHVGDGTLQLTWTLTSDFAKELGGWTLDDVCVVGLLAYPRCGDRVIDEGETCDDGNRERGDGCDETCRDEVYAGGGGGCDAGRSSSSALLALVALFGLRRRARP